MTRQHLGEHHRKHHVVVVGGGIAGLAAAQALLATEDPPQVTLLEASDHVGGKVRTSPFAGHSAIDEGPDAFLARLPWGTQLAKDVGLEDQLVSPASGSAAVWWNGLQPIPEGLLLGMPTDIAQLARTKLLSWPAKARAGLEPFLRRSDISGDSIGAYVRARFGDQVHERLVDPLIGSIYASDTDRFSLTAVPQIAELASKHRSVLLAARHRPPAPSGPVFYTLRAGIGALVDATVADIVRRGGEIRAGTPVSTLARSAASDRAGGWRVDELAADAVILACPAFAAGQLLDEPHLREIEYADVAMVTLAVPAADWPERLLGRSGYLVPKPKQRLVTAVSFGSQKWTHWNDGTSVILRISLGRDGLPVLHLTDDVLLDDAIEEVSAHLDHRLQPTDQRLTRWSRAFPQYRPNHHLMVKAIESTLPAHLALAGASYHGIGMPACIRSGRSAAEATLVGLHDAAE